LTVDKFTFTRRYEDIKLNSLNYGTNDVSRAGTTLAKANKTNVWIPGLEFFIKSVMTTIFTSVHKGFSPPGIKAGEDAENSLNTELGFRFDKGALERSSGITTISRICKVLILCLAVALEQVIYLMLVQPQ
jgi:Fe(3+) dicitrate transport protein